MLRRTIDDCDVHFQGYNGKYGGKITDRCGVYELSTEVAEQTKCELYPLSNGAVNFNMTNREVGVAAAAFCNNSKPINSGQRRFGQTFDVTRGHQSEPVYQEAEFGNEGMSVSVNGVDRCPDKPNGSFDAAGPECIRRMTRIMNDCKWYPASSESSRMLNCGELTKLGPRWEGGRLAAWTTNGCISYTFQAQGTLRNKEVLPPD